MIISVAGKEYEFIWATDVARDGIGLELWDYSKRKILAEIFRNDEAKSYDFQAIEKNLPLELIEELINQFNQGGGREFGQDWE